MTAATPIKLRVSPGDFVEISAVEKFDDGSGYASVLSIGSGRFSCSGHPFYFDDLKKFAGDLAKAYDRIEGNARLGHHYEQDFLEITVKHGGHVTVAGVVVQYSAERQELRFAFQCDQTFLPPLIKSLNQVIKETG